MDTWHVVPNNDLKPHTEVGVSCKCRPRVEVVENGNRVVVHNSYDGREFFEVENLWKKKSAQAREH